jgi:hypothetical protein
MALGNPKDEYLDASSNQRQFQSIRFGQLTVYLALAGVLLNLLVGGAASMSSLVRPLLETAGLLITVLFWIHQERTMAYWNHFVQRAAELEETLGFKQYSTRPPSGIISSFKAMRVFFLILTLFWASSYFWLV